MLVKIGSIGTRIVSMHIIAIVATSILMPLILYGLLSKAANDLHHRALEEQADEIQRYISRSPDGQWRLDLPPRVKDLYSQNYGRLEFAVVDVSGNVLFSSLEDARPVTRRAPPSTNTFFFQRQGRGITLYGVSVPERVGDQILWIQVAQDLEHRDVLIDDIVAQFFWRVGWITIPILLFLLVVDILIFRGALKPLNQASEMAEAIGPTRTDLRIRSDGLPREVLPLVAAVNRALDRLERGFNAQRDFAADAAHELRTPLAVLRARVDMIKDPEVAQSLRTDIAAMTRTVSQLLDIAESETLTINTDEKADLHAVCSEVVSHLAPIALAQDKSIALTGAGRPIWIRGNSGALFQAVRNLVENAIAHTPAGTTVEVDVSDTAIVSISDQGPGVKETERELIFRRFWRRDRQRPGSAGLGLSIVSGIVSAHGGSIAVKNRPSGGAVFFLALTAARIATSEPLRRDQTSPAFSTG